jgi:hypothetical protein
LFLQELFEIPPLLLPLDVELAAASHNNALA